MLSQNIVLIGFMGTGKSLCSHILHKRLKWNVLSTDEVIEKKEGSKISDIFKDKGEAYFRDLEKKIVAEISDQSEVIIDCGGGIVINPKNVENLRKNGKIICLAAEPETVLSNINLVKRDRPLLDVPDPLSKIRELMKEREKYYTQADVTIQTDGKKLEQVCDEILEAMKNDG